MIKVQIGSEDLIDEGPIDTETGQPTYEAVVFALDGVYGSGERRGDLETAPEANGVLRPERTYEGRRVIVIRGAVVTRCGDRAAVRAKWRAIQTQTRRSKIAEEEVTLKWQEDEDAEYLAMEVVLSDESAPREAGDGRWMIAYTITLDSVDANPREVVETQVAVDGTTGASQINVVVDNEGNIDAHPFIVIRGPVEEQNSTNGFVVSNETTDLRIKFRPGYSLAVDELLTIRMHPDKASVDLGAANVTQWGYVDHEVSDFFVLEPGENTIRLQGGGITTNTRVTVKFHSTYTS